MIRGNIAIPDKEPKSWRSRGRKRTRAQPALASAIVTPAPMKKRRQMTDDQEHPQRSAIVEPKKPRNTMLAHLIDDYEPGGAPSRWREGRRAVPARSCAGSLPISVTDNLPTARTMLPQTG
jgi:hypothetical protein